MAARLRGEYVPMGRIVPLKEFENGMNEIADAKLNGLF